MKIGDTIVHDSFCSDGRAVGRSVGRSKRKPLLLHRERLAIVIAFVVNYGNGNVI